MSTDGRYIFPPDMRAAYEALLAPVGVYQYVGGKVVTLLVSDGLCQFQGETRAALTEHFDNRMFENVHPDDVQTLAQMAYKFAIQVGKYDVVYRSRLYGKAEYRFVHAVSKYHTMHDGAKIAFTHYEDLTESVQSMALINQNMETPLVKFLNENATAMVIVSSKSHHLFYYNKAVCRLLQPQLPFDSAMTFQQFFYPDIPDGITGLFSAVDMGVHLVEEPRTHRKLEVLAVSTIWDREEAYAIYFYEAQKTTNINLKATDLRHRRLAFHNIMFSGASNDLDFWQDGYKAFRVWNLTKNTLVMDEGHNFLKGRYGEGLTYSLYSRDVMEMVPRAEERRLLERMTYENLAAACESGDYPRSFCFRLETPHGHVEMQTGFVLMRSPDDNDLYLKVMEENISQRVISDTLFHQAIERECDYIAYFDGKADTCRIISGVVTSEDQRDRLISIEDYLHNFRPNISSVCRNAEEFFRTVASRCRDKEEFIRTYELPNGNIKRVHIKMVDRENQLFYIYRSDVTQVLREERRRSAEIEALKNEAQAANAEKSMFIARMSHDLRTPMGAILSLAQFGLEECTDATCRSYFQQISDSGMYMLGMLGDILDVQKLASGKLELVEETLRAGDLEEHVYTIVKQRAQEKNLRFLTHHVLPTNYYMRGDLRRTERILINVLNNAIKYTPYGGAVTWNCHMENKENGLYIVHEIVDTGVGMSQDFLGHLFENFSQEKNRLSTEEGGTGLGLAIVKKLLDAMGGTINVTSELGKGSCFQLTIPCRQATAVQIAGYEHAHQQTAQATYDFTGCRVLVCEDNKLNQMIITKILKNAGCEVEIAADGLAGVQLVAQKPYDAVLMDVRMPVMDGLVATQEIRKTNKAIPIIALSANAYVEDIQKSLAAGMNDHLSKPIDTKKLFSVLHALLQ